MAGIVMDPDEEFPCPLNKPFASQCAGCNCPVPTYYGCGCKKDAKGNVEKNCGKTKAEGCFLK